MTYEELLAEIQALPSRLAMQEYAIDADHMEDDLAAAVAEVVVAANLARAAQDSLKVRVELARRHGATWRMVGKAIGLTPRRARQRKWETRPLGVRH